MRGAMAHRNGTHSCVCVARVCLQRLILSMKKFGRLAKVTYLKEIWAYSKVRLRL